jgi:hypothetical protein
MNVDDLLARAWSAVEKARVPPELQELAFKEALSFLRESDGAPSGRGAVERPAPTGGAAETADAANGPEASGIFARLAHESGVPETDLSDVLGLGGDSKISVTPATRKLGTTKAEQARNVIALVASARAFGLGEDPVSAELVRAEVKRKGCYDSKNFANHLGALNGFNLGGNRSQIVLTSKWLDEFKAAVAKAQGRSVVGES